MFPRTNTPLSSCSATLLLPATPKRCSTAAPLSSRPFTLLTTIRHATCCMTSLTPFACVLLPMPPNLFFFCNPFSALFLIPPQAAADLGHAAAQAFIIALSKELPPSATACASIATDSTVYVVTGGWHR